MIEIALCVAISILAYCSWADERAAKRRHEELRLMLLGLGDANSDLANLITDGQHEEILMRIATVAANTQTIRADLVRVELNSSKAAKAVELLPPALEAMRGSITAALQKVEESEVPLEISEQHKGAFGRVQRVREQMAAASEESWQRFLAEATGTATPKEP